MKLISTSTALLTLALATGAVLAQNVATVNGKAIPKAKADAIIADMVKSGQQQKTPELEKMVREELIRRELFLQEADKRGITTSEDVKLQAELARQAVIIRSLFADFQKKNPVTEADVKAEYDTFKAQAGDKEYRARHILVEKEDEAKDVISKLKGGAKFEDLAKKMSKDPGSGANGGDLDWAPPGAYVKEFSDAMVKLTKGQMTDAAVKTQFGYHIIKLDDTRAAQVPKMEEVKGEIEKQISQKKLSQFEADLRAKAKIQ
jgi:peptidyl-prolyl cis-trans isomerase C